MIAHELEAAGFDFTLARIESETELRREMEADKPDLILSDHGLPTFDGFKALEIVRDVNPELPFIFISGSNDQGMVARMYDAGATDYVFKNDLHDLTPAVREALESPPAPSQSPPPEPAPLSIEPVRLRLCPSCLRAHDEQGAIVEFLDCFRSHNEVTVTHELCETCRPITQLN